MPSRDVVSNPFAPGLVWALVIDAGPPRQVTVIDTVTSSGEAGACRIVEDDPSAPVGPPAEGPPERPAPWMSQPMPPGCWLPALLGGLLLVAVPLCRYFELPHLHLGAQEVIILLIIGVLLFGRQLPEVGRYLGKRIVEFKKGIRGMEDELGPLDRPRRVAKEDAPRRATVRYYSRMNPERVYPLLVLITRGGVAKVHKKHTDQRTSAPFAVDVDAPVEIEPVLPGCDCHPPKVVTRLGRGDVTLTFRVVPRVLGKVDGAVVSVRQDHTCLAEVELDVKVVKRTLVALSGAAAFLLPGLSAVMKHFGLDFATQTEQGFSLYLAAARLLFDRVSPLALTALLGVATALLWWLTRPRTRDVFWDVEKAGPEES